MECRNFFADHQHASPAPQLKEESMEEDGLDLSLGLCLGSVYADRKPQQQTDGDGEGEPLQQRRDGEGAKEEEEKTEEEACSNACADYGRPSRNQVWEALQKQSSGMIIACVESEGSDPGIMMNALAYPPSVRSTRSLPLQRAGVMATTEGEGITKNVASRQGSSIEALSEICLPFPPQSHQDEDLPPSSLAMAELLKRKELQAKRRQEARKRRRALLEDKHQKKIRHSSGLQRLDSNPMAFSVDRSVVSPVARSRSGVLDSVAQGDDVMRPRSSCNGPAPWQPAYGVFDHSVRNLPTAGLVQKEAHPPALTDVSMDASAIEDAKKACPSSTSSDKSGETRDETIAAQHKECGELEATGQSAVSGGPAVLTSMAIPAGGYPNALPILPIAYPYPVPFGLMPMQLGFSMPYLVHCPPGPDNLASSAGLDHTALYPYANGCYSSPVAANVPTSEDSTQKCSTSKECESEVSEGKRGEECAVLSAQPSRTTTFAKDQQSTMEVPSSAKIQHSRTAKASQQASGAAPSRKPRKKGKQSKVSFSEDTMPAKGSRSGSDASRNFDAKEEEMSAASRRGHRSAEGHEDGSDESQLASESLEQEVSNVQQGLAEERETSSSFPNLHWVSTRGTGPDAKMINGVMYISSTTRQVRLVCTCHGKNMSAAEFVGHSGSSDVSNPERSIVVNPFPVAHHQLIKTPIAA